MQHSNFWPPLGPAAWFMVGKDDDQFTVEFTDLDGVIIPDENGGQVILYFNLHHSFLQPFTLLPVVTGLELIEVMTLS